MGRSRVLPIALDDLEHGLALIEHPSGVAALDLGGGLLALKVRAHDGSVEYVTCDKDLNPLYEPAGSLLELKQRFTKSQMAT